jgi:hypothetical protein
MHEVSRIKERNAADKLQKRKAAEHTHESRASSAVATGQRKESSKPPSNDNSYESQTKMLMTGRLFEVHHAGQQLNVSQN